LAFRVCFARLRTALHALGFAGWEVGSGPSFSARMPP
jgi:hypothetical protein